jgi:hypothetical protein
MNSDGGVILKLLILVTIVIVSLLLIPNYKIAEIEEKFDSSLPLFSKINFTYEISQIKEKIYEYFPKFREVSLNSFDQIIEDIKYSLKKNVKDKNETKVKYASEVKNEKQVFSQSTQYPKEEKKYYVNKDKREIAKEIESVRKNSSYSEYEKKEKIKIIQRNVGEELFASAMRLVPVIIPEKKEIKSFDKYAKDMVKDSPGSSPFKEDPVGATIKIFFDPSSENIEEMLNLEEMFK